MPLNDQDSPAARAGRSQSGVNETRRGPGAQRRDIYGAVDLGTNNCRLLVARPTHGNFKIIDAYSKIVRLGEGLSHSGRLAEGAMDRAVEALAACARKIARRKVTRLRSVATEACRVALNSAEFVQRVHRETGLALDVITAEEEARLAVAGCQALFANGFEHAIVFDIGGGSTEIIWARLPRGAKKGDAGLAEVVAWTSLPYGVVTLTDSHGAEGWSETIYMDLVSTVSAALDEFGSPADGSELTAAISAGKVQFVGTSGTVTTLMSVLRNLTRYDRARIDGQWAEAPEIQAVARRVALMRPEERQQHPCIGPERADLVVPGCAVFEAILDRWPMGRLCIADRGIREGVLRNLMRRDPLVHAAQRGSRRRLAR